jgi:Bacteriocin-protection, YdeI or OmpD-Associated/Domain of unknown function (DUF1905)
MDGKARSTLTWPLDQVAEGNRTSGRISRDRGAAAAVTFKAVIELRGVNPYVLVSRARAARLKPGWRRPMPVLVQINGQPERPWRINMMPVGDGSFYLYLHGRVRTASATATGDRVTVSLRFDAAYRNGPAHPVPDWFRRGLAGNDAARASWTALAPSRRKEILRYFSGLKSDEARARNLKRAISVLAGEPGRFMARDWNPSRDA